MKKAFISLLFFIIIIGGILTGIGLTQNIKSSNFKNPQQQQNNTLSISPVQNQNYTPGKPGKLLIPAINIKADIEEVGLDSQGRMDIPSTDFTVGWFSKGYKPGEKGNAVIDGHLDQANGAPAIFWNLSKLKSGDKIIITDNNGKEFSFIVKGLKNYPYNAFPLTEVFGSSGKAGLNLITCEGTWDSSNKNYSHRTVVFSEMEE